MQQDKNKADITSKILHTRFNSQYEKRLNLKAKLKTKKILLNLFSNNTLVTLIRLHKMGGIRQKPTGANHHYIQVRRMCFFQQMTGNTDQHGQVCAAGCWRLIRRSDALPY